MSNILRAPFFLRKPPKTAGREEFGREFVRRIHETVRTGAKTGCCRHGHGPDSLLDRGCIASICLRGKEKFNEYVVSGGGANNPTLLAMLANELRPLELKIRLSDEFGLPSEAKEAAAFALMAFETWNRRPSNVPSSTGAKRLAILGKISYA